VSARTIGSVILDRTSERNCLNISRACLKNASRWGKFVTSTDTRVNLCLNGATRLHIGGLACRNWRRVARPTTVTSAWVVREYTNCYSGAPICLSNNASIEHYGLPWTDRASHTPTITVRESNIVTVTPRLVTVAKATEISLFACFCHY
jgi:hypothetical protein